MTSQDVRGLQGPCSRADHLEVRSEKKFISAGRAWAVGLGLGASLTLCSCSGTSGGDPDLAGNSSNLDANAPVVAVLETVAGSQSPFIIKGTIPVPPKTYLNKNQVPFTVLDYDGTASPTQVESVTFYPKSVDGADVVEIIAQVHLPPSVAPGTKLSYEVVSNPHKGRSFRLTPELQQVMKQPDSVMLVAHDVFGNEYKLDLLKNADESYKKKDKGVLRYGEAAATLRTHGVMMPTNSQQSGQSNSPLHHMFGAHAYSTMWRDENVLSLDLRIHNGLSGLDKSDPTDNPNADVYFADIEIWIPKGWSMFQQNPDPALGQPYEKQNYSVFPLVDALPGGKMHYMPQQGQFHRRLALAAPGQDQKAQAIVDELGRAFCKAGNSPTGGELWSWWNTQTGRYFPQRHVLPDFSYLGNDTIATKYTSELNKVSNYIASGTSGSFPHANPQMGWAHPWGPSYGGMTGGSEIQQWDGVQIACVGSIDGYRLTQLTHRMYSDRQPDVIYNLDGEQTRFTDMVKTGPNGDYLPMTFYQKLKGTQDPFGFTTADMSQVNYVKNNGLQPSYETQLAGFSPIDFQHYTRYTRNLRVLTWLGNDAMAKDDVKMCAELWRLSYNMVADSAAGYVGNGMLKDWQDVQSKPGSGFGFGRGEGWGLDIMNAAYSISDQAWRNDARPWFEDMVDLVAQGQSSCNGFIQSIVTVKMINGKYRVRQAIEQGIVESALRGTVESVFRGVDTGRTAQTEYVLEKSFYAMIGPMAWAGTGPHSYLAVAPLDQSLAPYCGSMPSDGIGKGVNHTQTYSSLAYAYEITGDQQFLQKAALIFGASNPTGLLSAIESQGFNLVYNRSALIASCQNLGL